MKKVLNLLFIGWTLATNAQIIGGTLLPWEKGFLDIHHINTGRGDAVFLIFPDSTTMLVDAGDMSESHPRTTSSRNAPLVPDNNKSAPQWIVDYIHQFFPGQRKKQLDYALITHYHDDHFGELDSLRTRHNGGYYLTGITEVGSLMPIRKLLDRGHSYPIDFKNNAVQNQERFLNDPYGMMATLKNYWDFITHQSKENGLVHEPLQVGSKTQIHMVNQPADYPDFYVRNVASNGILWTGEKEHTFSLFSAGEYPGENPLSNGIKITYGLFDYFTGGDISGIDAYGNTNMDAVESHLAPVIGPVDVATLNHHGNRDSQNAFYVRTIRPRVWVQQNWTADHPGEEVLRRITSSELYPGERDIFSTVMLRGAKEVIGDKLKCYKSIEGHVVVRVSPLGNSYEVFILNDKTGSREVLSKHGPYESR